MATMFPHHSDTLLRVTAHFSGDPIGWGAEFLEESELSWLRGAAPVDDI